MLFRFLPLKVITLLCSLFSLTAAVAQQKTLRRGSIRSPEKTIDTIRGIVRDENGKPLSGVMIQSPNAEKTKTRVNGEFTIPFRSYQTLTFEQPDFYFTRVAVKPFMEVQMFRRFIRNETKGDPDSIQKVTLLHGQQPMSTLIQSIGTAYTEQLVTTPSSQFLQALPGRIAGLNIGFTSGGPGLDGTGLNYNVRSARGSNIILIDGVQRSFLSIDPEEIESVAVLRDALATVMFGMRSSNGIISITTKKGNRGTPRISFTSQWGSSSPIRLPKPLAAAQFAQLFNEAQQNDAGTVPITPRYTNADIQAYIDGTDPYGHPNVDWYSTVLNKNSSLKRYNLNLQGSGKDFRYFVDMDKMTETGLLKQLDSNTYNTNSQLDRYLIRTNLGVTVTKTTDIQLNLFGRMQTFNQPGTGAITAGTGSAGIFSALATTPNNAYPVLNPDGSLAGTSVYGQNVNIYGQSVARGYSYSSVRDMAVDLQATQRLDVLIPGLYLKGQGSYNNSTLYNTNRSKDFAVYQYTAGNSTYTKIGNTSAQTNAGNVGARSRTTYIEALLGYEYKYGVHHINTIVLADQQSNMPFDLGNLPENYSDFAARIQYDLQEKYLFEASGSYAGYNYFSPEKRWSKFGALGLGWIVSKEAWVADHFPVISKLKIKGTWGLTGQANTGYYSYIQTYWTPGSNTNNNDGYYFGTNGVTRSTGQSNIAADLGPEKAQKLNLGIDLGLWNDQFSISAEYFKNKFYDVVGSRGSQTTLLGLSFPQTNLLKINYSGVETTLGWQSHAANFNYFVNANFSMVNSKVIYMDELVRKYDYQRLTGRQASVQNGYLAAGLFQSYAEINDTRNAVFASTPRSSLRPGDIRYVDRNNDGIINSDDQGVIGNGKPTIYFGITAGFHFRGLDFQILLQGTQNRQSYLNGDFWYGFGNGGNNNAYEYNLNRWTPDQPSASVPRVWIGSNVNNTQVSSFWLRNTDFIRLKNAEIGYTLPASFTRRFRVPSIRLFTNGLNLMTWSELFSLRKDVDPESLNSGSNYPYPILKTINFGVNVKF